MVSLCRRLAVRRADGAVHSSPRQAAGEAEGDVSGWRVRLQECSGSSSGRGSFLAGNAGEPAPAIHQQATALGLRRALPTMGHEPLARPRLVAQRPPCKAAPLQRREPLHSDARRALVLLLGQRLPSCTLQAPRSKRSAPAAPQPKLHARAPSSKLRRPSPVTGLHLHDDARRTTPPTRPQL